MNSMTDFDKKAYKEFIGTALENPSKNTHISAIQENKETKIPFNMHSDNSQEQIFQINKNLNDIEVIPEELHIVHNDKKLNLSPDTSKIFNKLKQEISTIDTQIENFKKLTEKVTVYEKLKKEKELKTAQLSKVKEEFSLKLRSNIAKFDNTLTIKKGQVSIIKPSLFNKVLQKLGITKKPDQALAQQLNNTIYNNPKNKGKINSIFNKGKKGIQGITDNADKIAEELLVNILSKANLNFLKLKESNTEKHETINQNQVFEPLKEKKDLIIIKDNQKYKFLNYSEDYKNLIVQNTKGEKSLMPNDEHLKTEHKIPLNLSKTQNNLLDQGQTLMVNLKINNSIQSFSLSKKENKLNLNPLTQNQFNALNIKPKIKNNKQLKI